MLIHNYISTYSVDHRYSTDHGRALCFPSWTTTSLVRILSYRDNSNCIIIIIIIIIIIDTVGLNSKTNSMMVPDTSLLHFHLKLYCLEKKMNKLILTIIIIIIII